MANGKLARSVSIIGAGYTPLGNVSESPEMKDLTERELFAWASMEAMENGHVRAKDIDAYYVGVSGPNYDSRFKSAAPFFGDWIGMHDKPTLFHDEACGSSAFGLEQAVLAVASGKYDCVISGAVNINTSVPKGCYPPFVREQLDNETLWNEVYSAIDAAYEKPTYGSVGPVEALLEAYAIKYGVTRDEIDDCFVNYIIGKRAEALKNPKAINVKRTYEEEARRFKFTDIKKYLLDNRFNPLMGSIVRARFLGTGVDAAASLIVCATDIAGKISDRQPIEVAGIATIGTNDTTFCQYPLRSDEILFREAYAMAGITDPYNEVEYMGIHDCPASMVIPVSEPAGYIKPGEAWKYMRDGEMNHDGKKPVNATGGRTQSGHPRSPAFAIEVTEAVSQMRGESGERQIPKKPKCSVVWGGGAGYNIGACVLKTL